MSRGGSAGYNQSMPNKKMVDGELVDGDEACGGCRFYLPTSDRSGLCRRQPPVLILGEKFGDTFSFDSAHPATPKNNWCGKFRPLDEEWKA